MKTENEMIRRLWSAAVAAWRPAWRTAWWVVRLTVPITLAMSCLDRLGVIGWVSHGLAPLFGLMGLPGDGALVFLTGACSNLYAAVAVMATLAIDYRSAIILAVMGLICHNLIIETAVQRRAGATGWQMALLRVAAAVVAGVSLNLVLPAGLTGRLWFAEPAAAVTGWGGVLVAWAVTMAPLVAKMLALIVGLNVLQSVLREFRIIDLLVIPLRPLMRVFGLADSTSFLWVICNVVGLTYGGAAIIDEVRDGRATPAEVRRLNAHVALSHSLLEDTLLFATVGLPLFWLLVPRMVLAAIVVWVQRLACRLTGKRSLRRQPVTQ